MFDNIGGKLKTWAKVFYAIELIAGIIYGIVKDDLIATHNYYNKLKVNN